MGKHRDLKMQDGFTDYCIETEKLQKILIQKAGKILVVVAHIKFSSHALFKTCSLNESDGMISISKVTGPNFFPADKV